MTEQFDEGVKEIVMTMLSLGATAYETDYILNQLNKSSEPIEQKITAVKQADNIIKSPKFDQVASEVINRLEKEVEEVEEVKPAPEKGSPEYIINRLVNGGLTKTARVLSGNFLLILSPPTTSMSKITFLPMAQIRSISLLRVP